MRRDKKPIAGDDCRFMELTIVGLELDVFFLSRVLDVNFVFRYVNELVLQPCE